jgi:hypothetical protein
LVKVPVAIAQRCRELRGRQRPRTNLLDEVDMRQKGAAWILLRIEDTDLLAKLLPHDFYRLQEVGIIRQHHGHIKAPHVSIVQQVRCKVYVRSLFLCLYDLHVVCSSPFKPRTISVLLSTGS